MNIFDKIAKIEALMASTKSEGERRAAEFAKQRLQEKIDARQIEYTARSRSRWEKQLFHALCKKYGLQPYRYARQKYTTTMVRSTQPFMKSILWPEYLRYLEIFEPLVEEVLGDLITKIHRTDDDEEVIVSGEIPTTTTHME